MKYLIVIIIISICSLSLNRSSDVRDLCQTDSVKVQIREQGSNKPRTEIELRVYKIRKPLFTMWQFHELYRIKSNNNGIFTFKIKKTGSYSFRFYDYKGNRLYSTDEIKIKSLKEENFFEISW